MDPKMLEINNLRVLNDYLNQTIEVLLRAQRLGGFGFNQGLSHTPYGVGSIFGSTVGLQTDPTYAGLSHTPWGQQVPPFAAGIGQTPFGTGLPVLDPFIAQRTLSHTPAGLGGFQQWGQVGEIARQSQMAQAIAARQQVLEALCRSVGIPV